MYLALYGPKGLVISDHRYNADYARVRNPRNMDHPRCWHSRTFWIVLSGEAVPHRGMSGRSVDLELAAAHAHWVVRAGGGHPRGQASPLSQE